MLNCIGSSLVNKTLFIVCISLTFWLLTSFQLIQNTQNITWNVNRPLQWSDFQGSNENKKNENNLCATKTEISMRSEFHGNKTIHLVKCYFIKSKSWKKDNLSDALLQHEQLHFDIAELFARKLRKALSTYVKTDTISLKDQLQRLYKANNQECIKFQYQYDQETSHAMNQEMQARWNLLIKNHLQDLENYHNATVSIEN